jgi:BirA family transcriptional regulator, biotin operon repressor / biotin---[acetyl-CoA-carboxylase] ligase
MPLNLDLMAAALQNSPFGHTVDIHDSLPSTMAQAHRLAGEGRPDDLRSGIVVVAEEQTAGRGRLHRRWEAAHGQALLVSIVVAGPHLPDRPAQLPMVAGLAGLSALEAILPDLAGHLWLKWPNDLLLGQDAACPGKVGGILVESVYRGDCPDYAILGIGINVNQAPETLPPARPGGPPPTSVCRMTRHPVHREPILVALCRELNRLLAAPDRPTPARIHAGWQARLHTLGRPVRVRLAEGRPPHVLAGTALETTVDGHLVVQDDAGRRHLVAAGDVESLTT